MHQYAYLMHIRQERRLPAGRSGGLPARRQNGGALWRASLTVVGDAHDTSAVLNLHRNILLESEAPSEIAGSQSFLPDVAEIGSANGKRLTADVFPQHHRLRFSFALFFPAQFVKSCEIAAQSLRKNLRTIGCAKDAEKARKICGFGCGIAAIKRWICGGKQPEMRSTICGTKPMKARILKLVEVFSIHDDFILFWSPLDRGFYWA